MVSQDNVVLAQYRHVDQWNRTKIPEINTRNTQPIHFWTNKTKLIQGKRTASLTNGTENSGSMCVKMQNKTLTLHLT